MAATAQTIINRALRLIGAISSGESPTTDESNDGLTALNAMLESWQLDRLTVFAFQDKTFTLVAADGSITLGAAGNITTRPDRIESVHITASGTDYPVTMVTAGEWYSIASKTVQSDIPEYGYYEPSYPLGILNLWPVPSAANTLHVVMWTPFTAFASLSTAVSLPPGYERALAYNLAIDIAPEYEKKVSDEVAKGANDSLAAIRRGNNRPMIAGTDLPFLIGNGRGSNIVADTP